MAKGYWVANMDVTDPETYEKYKQANAAPFARHGARFLVRAGQQRAAEGPVGSRTVIIEFPSYAAAVACYDDPEYQAAIRIREKAASGKLLIVEGYDG